MGFYGNIRNTTSNSFKFDRVYSNRTLMEQNADSDGVFGGRYVLVEYDQALDENPVQGSKTIYKVKISIAGRTEDRYFTEIDSLTNTDPLPEAYTTDSQDEQGKLNGDKVFYIKFIAKTRKGLVVNGGFTYDQFLSEWCVGQDDETYDGQYVGTVIDEKAYTKIGGDYSLYYTVGLNPTINIVRNVQIYDANEETVKSHTEMRYLYTFDYFTTHDSTVDSSKRYYTKENGTFIRFTGSEFVSGIVYYEKTTCVNACGIDGINIGWLFRRRWQHSCRRAVRSSEDHC